MAKKNIINIDLSIWATPRQLASELGYDKNHGHRECTQRITNWIKREKIESWTIAELGITLVNRNSLPKSA